ncbi:hypothetical protein RRG08_035347 [Elysia crispata]|uniref:Uncharacterized protein n=1 Tax=Elysia crispata TaxID=231223 RepID=A0AAE1CS09_9GAST|nr:hypothetical protein RRG08_035347 [Elysia crispata]
MSKPLSIKQPAVCEPKSERPADLPLPSLDEYQRPPCVTYPPPCKTPPPKPRELEPEPEPPECPCALGIKPPCNTKK